MLTRMHESLKAREDKGFTLIELLVVIIIIGILAAIAIPIFLNQRKKGVDASMKSDVKTVATQLETYFTENQTYPGDIAATTVAVAIGSETAPLSPGNSVVVNTDSPAVGTFRVCVSNPNGSYGTDYIVYDSSLGGLQSAPSATC